jgi:hypothetical protein
LSDAIHEVKKALGPGPKRVAALLNLISHGLGQDPQVVWLVDTLTGTFARDTSVMSYNSLKNAYPISRRNS